MYRGEVARVTADDPDEFFRGECDEVVVWQDVKPMPTSNTAEASFWLVICTSFFA
jgi:hypothetical protein